ncbi:MAG: hypothetical protein WCD66_02465 [Rhodanobacteraceae bacterium]
MSKLQPFKLKSEKGFALWDTLLLVALIGALLLVAFVSQHARSQMHLAQDQDATLLWADQQVAGFTSSHLRLPCPDTNNDGLEDCGSGTTSGLLPVQTLGLKADAATRGPVRILYSLLRPSGMDPTVLESYFEPEMWDGTKYSYGTANGLDFCRKLADIVAGNSAAVAYTVGLKRLDGEGDLKRSRSVSDLSNNLSCITTMSSVNGIALAVDVVNEVLAQQESTKQAAIITIAFNVLHIALTAIDVSLAAIGLAASITALGVASGLLAGAIASCVVLVGCALIPPYTAAVVAAGVAIGLYGVAIGLGAAAIVALVVSTGLAIDVAIKTGNDPGDQTLDVNLSDIEQAAIDAENTAASEEAKATAAYNTMIQAQNTKNSDHSYVVALADYYDAQNTHDPDVNAALSAAETLDNASQARDQAQGELDQANDRVAKMTDAYSQQQTSCAGANLPDEQYKCDAVPEVYDRLVQAQQDVPVKQAALNSANTQLSTATTNYNNALAKVRTDFGEPASCGAFSNLYVSCSINKYKDDYLKWLKAKEAYQVQHENALKARDSAIKARDAYNQIKAQYENPGTTPTGSAITVWAGAEAILKQADANGVVE